MVKFRQIGLCKPVYWFFESDNVLLGTCRLPHRGSYERDNMQVASLDHAMWFHRPIDLEDRLCIRSTRQLVLKQEVTREACSTPREGALVASTIQEGLILPTLSPLDF